MIRASLEELQRDPLALLTRARQHGLILDLPGEAGEEAEPLVLIGMRTYLDLTRVPVSHLPAEVLEASRAKLEAALQAQPRSSNT